LSFQASFPETFDYLIYIFRMLTEMTNLKMVSNLRNFVFYVCSNFFFLVHSFFFFCLCQTYFLCFSLPNLALAYVSVFKLFLLFGLFILFSLCVCIVRLQFFPSFYFLSASATCLMVLCRHTPGLGSLFSPFSLFY